jgi:transcriptional regulator with XRE-family HTH domain
MTLQQYLEETGTSRTQFAERIGVKYETVRRYLDGSRIPDRRRMAQIALATGGNVTANDFFALAA